VSTGRRRRIDANGVRTGMEVASTGIITRPSAVYNDEVVFVAAAAVGDDAIGDGADGGPVDDDGDVDDVAAIDINTNGMAHTHTPTCYYTYKHKQLIRDKSNRYDNESLEQYENMIEEQGEEDHIQSNK
jgi:hypothetical protein